MTLKLHLFILFLGLMGSPLYAQELPLTVQQAETIALSNDPLIAQYSAESTAMNDMAIAEGELPDPKFKLELDSLPTDTFKVDTESMTQLRAGVVQMFPRGKTLEYKREQKLSSAQAKQVEIQHERLTILRAVREYFLEIYYQVQALLIIEKSAQSFERLVKNAEMHYATGHGNQQDVVKMQLELARLEDEKAMLSIEEKSMRSELSQWLKEVAYQPIDKAFPRLHSPDKKEIIQANLINHPVIYREDKQIEIASWDVKINEEQYKPEYDIELTYGKRFGQEAEGMSRPDLVSAMLTIDFPLFPDKRQNKMLSASKQELLASRYMRTDKLRMLSSLLEKTYAQWQGLNKRYQHYQQKLLPDSQLNIDTALTAYQSGVTDFSTVIYAQLTRLEMQLSALRIQVDSAKAQATLLYLMGK
jgi:outer membrane protein TolC